MDVHEVKLKQENYFEDSNDNYLTFDFEVGVKIENDTPALEDWCLQNANYEDRQSTSVPIAYDIVKEECNVQTCFICFREFADSSSLYEHNLTHLSVVLTQPKHLYQCDYCLIYCTSKVKIKQHIQVKHFLSLKCKKVLATQTNQRCNICNKTLPYKSWHSHMKEVHSTEKLKCTDCNITFKCARYLQRHWLYKHGNVRPSWRFHKIPIAEVKCDQCPTVFQNKSSYKAHIRNCHSNEMYECTLCRSKLKCKSYLQVHMKRVHYNDGILYKCDICYKIFQSPRYLNIHKKNSHTVRVINKVARQR